MTPESSPTPASALGGSSTPPDPEYGSAAAHRRRSTAWALLLLVRLVVMLPVYLVVVLGSVGLQWIGERIVRLAYRGYDASDTLYRAAGVENGRLWIDGPR